MSYDADPLGKDIHEHFKVAIEITGQSRADQKYEIR